MVKYKKIFRNEPSPHYEDWFILENKEMPSLEELSKLKKEKINYELKIKNERKI